MKHLPLQNKFNFNSRPSARGDGDEAEPSPEVIISIHAPPRGATALLESEYRLCRISIHAPPRGATVTRAESERELYFNSRPSARGDCMEGRKELEHLFQFTPLREGRRDRPLVVYVTGLFQFTPLREGRLATLAEWAIFQNFNSRPSARGDALFIVI